MTLLKSFFLIALLSAAPLAGADVTEGNVKSADGLTIAYRTSGQGSTALVFVHGWSGNAAWWEDQRAYFSKRYQVVQIDLAGHGRSDKGRKSWTAKAYGEDIRAVVEILRLQKVVLVGHSMSGTNAVEAQDLLNGKVAALVPVDTLFDLDSPPSQAQATAFFSILKADWKAAMETFSKYVFTEKTPAAVQERLRKEMEGVDPTIAIPALETVYTTDIRPLASKVTVPVRAIQSDMVPTNLEANRKYFKDYDFQLVKGYGHFPMLEAPEEFNQALDAILKALP